MDKLLSVAEVSKILSLTPIRVRKLIRSGHLYAANVATNGGRPHYRIKPEDVNRFLADRRVDATKVS